MANGKVKVRDSSWLLEMESRDPRSYSQTTAEIRVTVVPEFVSAESNPDESVYAFTYTVTLENHGTETMQLISRQWKIESGGEIYHEVNGQGVVGLQPILQPKDEFQYSSWTVIKDPVGRMWGSYTFSRGENEFVDVEIPCFDLIHLSSVH